MAVNGSFIIIAEKHETTLLEEISFFKQQILNN